MGTDKSIDERQSHRLRRGFERFRQAGIFQNRGQAFTVLQAVSIDDLLRAYRLVLQSQNGFQAVPEGFRIRAYEALPEAATFIAKATEQVLGVIGVVPDSRDVGLPSDPLFGEEIDTLRKQGRRIGEVTNVGVSPANRNPCLPMDLSRCVYAHAVNLGLDDLFVSIDPGQSLFYSTVLGFTACGDRRHEGKNADEVMGMRLDVQAFAEHTRVLDEGVARAALEPGMHEWFFSENPYYDYARASAKIARRFFLNACLLREMFVERSSLVHDSSPAVLDALRSRWGPQLFDEVVRPVGGRADTPAAA